MRKIDYHIHTEYSCDSALKAKDLINKAISLDYEAIAFTEHLDLLPQELSIQGLPSFAKYIRSVAKLKAEYCHASLMILCGIEIGDYQITKPFALGLLNELEFELVLGAVHFLSDHTNVAMPLERPLSPEGIEDYYKHNLDLVTNCDIDVLAHLGVYKRYYPEPPDESHCRSLVKDILHTMIERGIALEINLSSFRKPYGRLTPEPWQIELYRELGGDLFSIGSDSHQLDHFDAFYHQLPTFLFEGVRFIR